jgi:hypothetical protein
VNVKTVITKMLMVVVTSKMLLSMMMVTIAVGGWSFDDD